MDMSMTMVGLAVAVLAVAALVAVAAMSTIRFLAARDTGEPMSAATPRPPPTTPAVTPTATPTPLAPGQAGPEPTLGAAGTAREGPSMPG